MSMIMRTPSLPQNKFFPQLTSEINNQILFYLPASDLKTAKLVCKKWREQVLQPFIVSSETERVRFFYDLKNLNISKLGIRYISLSSPIIYMTFFISKDKYKGSAKDNYETADRKFVIVGEKEADLMVNQGELMPTCEGIFLNTFAASRNTSTNLPFVVTQYESHGVDIKFAGKVFSQICKN